MAKMEGIDKVLKNLNHEINMIRGRTLKGLIRAQIIVRRDMEKTFPRIPVDTGNLRASYFVITSDGSNPEGQSPRFKGDQASRMSTDHSVSKSKHSAAIKGSKDPSLIMGFSAFYAWYVHENVDANFGAEGRRANAGAKFLQRALDRNKDKMLKVIHEEAKILP